MKDNRKDKENKTKPKYNMWQNSAFMVQLSFRYCKSVFWLCVLMAVLTASIGIVEVLASPVILSKLEQKVSFSNLMAYIAMFIGFLALLSAIKAYVNENTLFGRVTIRTEIIGMLGEKNTNTSYPNTLNPNFETLRVKSMDSCNGNSDATEAIWTTLEQILANVIGFVVYLFLLSSLNFWIVILVLSTTLISYFASKKINEWGYVHREELNVPEKQMFYLGKVATDRQFSKDIRIFGLKAWLDDLYGCAKRAYNAVLCKQEFVYFWANVIDMVMTFLRNAIAYYSLIKITLEQGLPASQFLLYFNVLTGFSQWMTLILDGLSTLHKQSLDISIIREFLEWPEPFKFEEGKALIPDHNKKYEIKLDDVSYRYSGAQTDILKHINLTIAPGEKLAVVGLNGAGKTTLVKLICGLLDPTDGRILLNGEDIRQFNRRDYYKLFSAVFQDFSVLDIGIKENVAQTFVDIDEKKVERCLEEAALTQKISELPKGVETPVGRRIFSDGVELSGGQMQRLMLARALYKDGPILVLDEPTAALDPIAESDIYQKYSEMANGKLSIFISHRLASTRFCDRILFVANGGIEEEGTHEELLAKKGSYAEIFEVQSKYYKSSYNSSYNKEELKNE